MSSKPGRPSDERLIERFIRAVATANVEEAMTSLSQSFGQQEGLDAREFVAKEIEQFARLVPAEDDRDFQCVVIERSEFVHFDVLSSTGDLVYRDRFLLDEDCRIKGDGSAFQIVAKRVYRPGTAPSTSVAIRSPRGDIVSAVPLDPNVVQSELRPAAKEIDGFVNVSLEFVDGPLPQETRLRIRDSSGFRQTERITLPKAVSPADENDTPFPKIEGKTVYVPKTAHRPWTLMVFLETGEIAGESFPLTGVKYAFSAPVIEAVLSDVFDNDWIANSQALNEWEARHA